MNHLISKHNVQTCLLNYSLKKVSYVLYHCNWSFQRADLKNFDCMQELKHPRAWRTWALLEIYHHGQDILEDVRYGLGLYIPLFFGGPGPQWSTLVLELAWYISLGGWVIPVGFMTSNWSYFEFSHQIHIDSNCLSQ